MDKYIKSKIEQLLMKEYFCSYEELNSLENVYTVRKTATSPYLKIMAYRNSVVICTSQNISETIKGMLQGKSRVEIFEMPFVYGQTIHYVPDCTYTFQFRKNTNYDFQILFDDKILFLQGLEGFGNSLEFDDQGKTSTRAVCIARNSEKVIGLAGAAPSSIADIWELGVDVLPEYRKAGLGTSLVRCLTKELQEQNIVPFYSASVTNIGSQLVAARSGYLPAWVDTYGTILDGSSSYQEILDDLTAKFFSNKKITRG